jgi:hypothetical protein
MRVANGISLSGVRFLPDGTVNCVQALKVEINGESVTMNVHWSNWKFCDGESDGE